MWWTVQPHTPHLACPIGPEALPHIARTSKAVWVTKLLAHLRFAAVHKTSLLTVVVASHVHDDQKTCEPNDKRECNFHVSMM